jgi:hypothetical protein
MRDSSLALLTLSLLTISLSAQIASVSITNVSEKAAQPGKSRLVWKGLLENHSSSSIVAFHSTFVCPSPTDHGKNMSRGSGYDAFEQHTVLDDIRLIPVGGVAEVNAADPYNCTGGVDSIVFSDHHSEGDLRWVNLKHQEWAGLHTGIVESLRLLDRIADQEARPEEVADVFRDRIQLIPNGTRDTKKWGERSVYVQLESLLRGKTDVKSPLDPIPHSPPRVEETNEANGIPRQKAQAMYLVNKLQEWKTALEDNLEPRANPQFTR